MKALKTKVILSAAVLLFALVATIGSTYAWFTVASTNTVEAMTLNVQSAESLLIKVANPATAQSAQDTSNAATYFTQITTAMISGAGAPYENLSTWRLAPVTAVNDSYTNVSGEFANLNEFTTNLNQLRALDPIEAGEWAFDGTAASFGVDVNSATGSVITIGFWVMSQASSTKQVRISSLALAASNAISSRDVVIQAGRVAVKVGEDAAYIYSNSGAVDYSYEYLINLPGYYSGATYSGTTLLGFNQIDSLTLGYSGVLGDPVTEAELAAMTTHRVAGTDVIGDLAPDVPELMLITIFVEGWDAQCTNATISAAFTLTFAISFVA